MNKYFHFIFLFFINTLPAMDLNHSYGITPENLQHDVAQVKNIRELIKRSPDIIRQRTQEIL